MKQFFHKRPHILHVIDSLALGGAERVLVEIANATDKNRYRVSVCVTRFDTTLVSKLEPSVSVYQLARRKVFEFGKFMEMGNLCKTENVDLIHIHMRSSFLFICTLRAMRILPNIPIIFVEHNGDIEIDNRIPLTIRLGLNLFHPYFVGVHGGLTEAAIKIRVPESKAYTIRNAIDFAPYSAYPSLPVEQIVGQPVELPVGILIANVRPTKDHLFLIQALAELKDEKWTMLIAGGENDPDYLAACKQKIKEFGLAARIIFLGPRTDIPQLLRCVDFGVLSSKSESGPIVLLEYIAAGLPFVSTRVGLIGKSLYDLGIPCLVETRDFKGFVEGLRELIHLSPEARIKRTKQALELASPEFDIKAVMPQWYRIYNQALEDAR